MRCCWIGANTPAAIGKLTRDKLRTLNQWDALADHTAAFKTTVIDVANDLKIGAADAGIVYDSVLHSYPTLEAVPVDELSDVVAHVKVGLFKSTTSSAAALRFAKYLSAREHGLQRYREFGFTVDDQ